MSKSISASWKRAAEREYRTIEKLSPGFMVMALPTENVGTDGQCLSWGKRLRIKGEHKPRGFILHPQHPARIGFRAAQLDRSTIDRDCEQSGHRTDLAESLKSQYIRAFRMLTTNRHTDQRPLIDFAEAERVADCSVRAVRQYRLLNRLRQLAATKRAALRIIETAQPVAEREASSNPRQVKPLDHVLKGNKAANMKLQSAIKRVKASDCFGWNPDA